MDYSADNILLSASHLQKIFEGKTALDDVSFDVYRGEFLSILGPSGCGKTTILRILIGLLEPTSGTLTMEGVDITSFPPAERNMGIVFQNYALFENMTVLQNVQYALKLKMLKERAGRKNRQTSEEMSDAPKTGREIRLASLQIAEDMLIRMGLEEHLHKKPSELSGGQQQRVAIARTLVLNPRVILFDEPMAALDVATRLALREELKKIQTEFGTTMIYITHDQEEAFALSDRIMVMREAQLVQLDTPMALIESPANDYVREFVIGNLQTKIKSLVRFVGE